MASYVPSGIEKVNRSQFLTYLNTTPSATDPKWDVLGVGITEYGIAFNPQVDTEKWIIEDNARNDHSSNQKQGSVTQKCYKGDPVFEFINAGRDQLNYKTQVLDIDRWNGTGTSYPAKVNDVIITVTNYMGENAEIEYDIYYDGDATEGTVTFTGNTPTFTPTTSL
jgi:hypothetical protein